MKLNTLQHKLEVKGEHQITIRNKACGKLSIIVVYGRIQSSLLIGKNTGRGTIEGIEKKYDEKNGTEILGKFYMKPQTVPVAQKTRQVPYYLQAPFKTWIDEGVEGDLFEKDPA